MDANNGNTMDTNNDMEATIRYLFLALRAEHVTLMSRQYPENNAQNTLVLSSLRRGSTSSLPARITEYVATAPAYTHMQTRHCEAGKKASEREPMC